MFPGSSAKTSHLCVSPCISTLCLEAMPQIIYLSANCLCKDNIYSNINIPGLHGTRQLCCINIAGAAIKESHKKGSFSNRSSSSGGCKFRIKVPFVSNWFHLWPLFGLLTITSSLPWPSLGLGCVLIPTSHKDTRYIELEPHFT